MIGLRGIKLDNSKLGLVVYLPMNIPLATRTAMEKTVKDSLTKLNLNRGGCLYDTEIENM